LIPTIGFLVVMAYLPGLELYSIKAKYILLVIVFISTGMLPLIFLRIISLSPGYNRELNHHKERILPYLFNALSSFLGLQLLIKLPFHSVYSSLMIGTFVLLVFLSIISFWWKISEHTAGIGGLLGILLALIFKYGLNLLYPVIATILIAGAVASSRLYLKKHTPSQVYAGFGFSALLMFILVYIY
jgi:membrane-associated phospholipid phosphatase